VSLKVFDVSCKDKYDIIAAVIECRAHVLRPFRVVASEKRRYKAVYPIDGCTFVVQFAFKTTLKKPPRVVPHSCQVDVPKQFKNRKWTAKQLARNPEVREHYIQCGRDVTAIAIKHKVEKMGFLATYMNCVNTCKRPKEEFYGNEYSQYSLIPSYIEELKKNGHKARYDTVNGTFS
jgi:hypothetical protein